MSVLLKHASDEFFRHNAIIAPTDTLQLKVRALPGSCIDFRAAPVMKMVGAIDKRANDQEDRPQLPAFPAFVWHSVKTCCSNSGHKSQKPTDRIRHFAVREACYAEPTITG
ncbi:hypothetical protein SRHO_G00095530 [Serrasalmus rhombeus]